MGIIKYKCENIEYKCENIKYKFLDPNIKNEI